MACKSGTVIVTTREGIGLGLTAAPPSRGALILPGIILSPASDRVADPSGGGAESGFWRQQVPKVILNDAQRVEECKFR